MNFLKTLVAIFAISTTAFSTTRNDFGILDDDGKTIYYFGKNQPCGPFYFAHRNITNYSDFSELNPCIRRNFSKKCFNRNQFDQTELNSHIFQELRNMNEIYVENTTVDDHGRIFELKFNEIPGTISREIIPGQGYQLAFVLKAFNDTKTIDTPQKMNFGDTLNPLDFMDSSISSFWYN